MYTYIFFKLSTYELKYVYYTEICNEHINYLVNYFLLLLKF